MKKIIINIIILLIGIFIGLNLYHPYDADRDGQIGATDYVVIKNYIMNDKSLEEKGE